LDEVTDKNRRQIINILREAAGQGTTDHQEIKTNITANLSCDSKKCECDQRQRCAILNVPVQL
jgi:hypothetical protein